jgi:hypothetical protein
MPEKRVTVWVPHFSDRQYTDGSDTRLTPADRVFEGQLVSPKMQKPRKNWGFAQ